MSRGMRKQGTVGRTGGGQGLALFGEGIDWNRWFWLGFTALFLARWFVPAEAPDLGITLWISFLTLLLAAGASWLQQGERTRWTRLDLCVALFIGGHCLSTVYVLVTGGDRRAALNIGWEWGAVGATYGWLRRTLFSEANAPGSPPLRMEPIVLAVALLAGLGIWQHHVWYPRMAKALNAALSPENSVAQPDATQQMLAQELRGSDEVSRQLLKSRLLDSTEPFGKFSLANTLAGVLCAGVFLGAAGSWQARRQSRPLVVLWGMCTILILYCLLLTKSRTAYAGTLAAAFYVAGYGAWSTGRWMRKRLAAAGIILGVVAAGGIATLFAMGSLDREVLTESSKSLQYRLEYWWSSLAVLQEQPLFGTGPGNFRQHYLAYKLPQSSEEILDPHNEFLDVWANGGLLGLSGFLGVWLLVVRRLIPRSISSSNLHPATIPTCPSILATSILLAVMDWVWRGSVEPQDLLLFGVWLVSGMIADIFRMNPIELDSPDNTRTSALWIGAAWIALSVHLLGAGGIGMAAVVQLWLWLVVMLHADEASVLTVEFGKVTDRWTRVVPLVWLLAAIGCLWTSLIPNSQSQQAVEIARAAMRGRVPISTAIRDLEEAIHADSLAPEPRQSLAEILNFEWQRGGRRDEQLFAESIEHQDAAIARDPLSPKRQRVLGDFWWDRYQQTHVQGDAQQALKAFTTAVQLYPHHAAIHANYALALAACGENAEAAARFTLELDRINQLHNHVDKLLPADMRSAVEALLQSAPAR